MALNYPTEVIVLATRDTGGADKILTLFSREYGKIKVMAYGVRNSKKRRSGNLQSFAHLDISVTKSKNTQGLDTLDEWQVLTSFRKLREDLFMMAYANFLCELVNELWLEKEADSQIFELILQSFELLSTRNPRMAALMGAFKLIALAGFRPSYDNCVHCGNDITSETYFDILAGGAVCLNCRKNSLTEPSEEALRNLTTQMVEFLRLIENISLKSPGKFSINAKTLSQTESLIFGHISHSLERPLKSVSFIEKINSFSMV